MLGRRDPVRVDSPDVLRVGLAAPADQELGGRVLALDDLALGHRRRIAARRLRDQRERRGGEAPEVDPRVVCLDVDQLPETPLRPERREPGLEVGHRRPARLPELEVLGRRHPRLEAVVHQQAPDLLEGVAPDELLDVDAAVAERGAFPVRLRDLGLEGDDALEAGSKLVHAQGRY